MISCIICSRNINLQRDVRRNIDETIGVEHEVIVIDNSSGERSIFSAYNEGVRRSHGDVLCFMHEDVIIHTNYWGSMVDRAFADDSIGLVGVIGGHVLPDFPSSWWTMHYDAGQVIDRNGKVVKYWARRSEDQSLMDVVSVDGLWFCVRTSLFGRICFDERTFDDFHCYDSDICMQVLESGKRVTVCFDIFISHLSDGRYGPAYRNAVSDWYHKWRKHLPISAGIDVSGSDMEERMRLVSDLYEADGEIMKLRRTVNGRAFRIATFICRPFRFLKKLSDSF